MSAVPATELDPVIHQPVRMKIMTALYRYRQIDFPSLRDGIGLTAGNLATHLGKLEQAGYVDSGRMLVGVSFQVRYRITDTGSAAFTKYLDALRRLLDSMERGVVQYQPRSEAVRRALKDDG